VRLVLTWPWPTATWPCLLDGLDRVAEAIEQYASGASGSRRSRLPLRLEECWRRAGATGTDPALVHGVEPGQARSRACTKSAAPRDERHRGLELAQRGRRFAAALEHKTEICREDRVSAVIRGCTLRKAAAGRDLSPLDVQDAKAAQRPTSVGSSTSAARKERSAPRTSPSRNLLGPMLARDWAAERAAGCGPTGACEHPQRPPPKSSASSEPPQPQPAARGDSPALVTKAAQPPANGSSIGTGRRAETGKGRREDDYGERVRLR